MATRAKARDWAYEDEAGRRMATECFDRVPESVAEARQLATEAMAKWQMEAIADRAELVTSELATNAVLHARRAAFRVTLRGLGDHAVRIEVYDFSRTMPALFVAGAHQVHGRGLALVDAVSQCWGTDRLPWGKRVWAHVEAPTAYESPVPVQPDETPIWATRKSQAVYMGVVLVAMGSLAYGMRSR
ncbi:ATP-binding protein [Streptomyces sp. KHY 26]|uniref:ATP-binding protein n=1 Tax=Streptomyces sp. KHY 26 TaxID=3097359 RepID=UPI00376EB9B6